MNPDVLILARETNQGEPDVNIQQMSLQDVEDGQFTAAVMSQMLHHLSPAEAVNMLNTTMRKVSTGIIISDFIRSKLNYYLAKLAISLTNPTRFNLIDGPLSILRSYTDQEIAQIMKEAGITKYKIYNFLLRKIIVIKK